MQPPSESYARYTHLYNESPSGDSHQRAEMVTDLLDAADKVSLEQAIEIAFCTQVWRAEHWQARLKEAWEHASAADRSGDAQQLYTLIQEWDRKSAPDSRGALAYYAFKKALGGDAARQVSTAGEPDRWPTDRGRAKGRGLVQVAIRRARRSRSASTSGSAAEAATTRGPSAAAAFKTWRWQRRALSASPPRPTAST